MAKAIKIDPQFVGSAHFANGTRVRIDRINTNGACSITCMRTGEILNYARSVANAWSAVSFIAGLNPRTFRSRGADDYKTNLALEEF